MLDAMAWIGGSGNWSDASHWQDITSPGNHALPVAGDTVTIDTGATAATITVQSSDNLSVANVTTTSNDTLSITGGALTVTTGASTLSGPLSMTGGTLTVQGAGATLTANGAASISGGNLSAYSGGVFNLPTVTTYTAPASGSRFEAGDAGSQINLSNLTTLNGAFNGNVAYVHVFSGASIDMHQLSQVTSGAVWFRAEGSGSSIDLAALTNFAATSANAALESDSGATLDIGALTTVDKASVIIGGTASVSQITSVTNGNIAARDGATATFSGLTTFTGDGFYAYAAGVLNLPTVTSYSAPSTGSKFEAGDAGSQINLSNLMTFNGAFNGNVAYVHVYGGASIDMHQLPQVTSGAVWFRAEGSGSSINLASLTNLAATSSNAALESDNGATLDIGSLTTLDKVALIIGGAASVSQITALTNGNIEARDGATATFSGLTTLTGDGFYAYTAGVLNLPTVTSYAAPATGSKFEAGDAGSQINLSNLTTFNGAFNGNVATVHVYGGASIDMHQLPQITSGAIYFQAQGSGSTIDLSALTTFTATGANAELESDTTATLDIGSLTTLDKVALIIGGAASVSQITTLTNGNIEARDGATPTFSGLTTFTGDGFYAYLAGVLNLPTVTTYSAPATGSKFEAGDAGSKINLSNLTTFNGATNGNYAYVHAYGGASIDMHQLPQITSGAVYFQAQNSGSTIDLSALTAFTATSPNAALESDTGATLDIGNLTTLDKVAMIVGGAADVSQITSVTNGSIQAHDFATATFSGLTTFTGDSFYADTAGVLNLPTVASYTGSSVFGPTIQAGDSGSEINLSNLTTLDGSTNGNYVYVHAYGGAMIDMHQLPQITSGAVYFRAENAGSTINLSALTTFTATSANAALESDTGATLDIGNLTTLDNVALIIGGAASLSQITNVTNGSITARDGATATFSGLATFTGDSFYARSGGVLNLPTVTSYTGPSTFGTVIEAGNSGSEINLPNLTTMNGSTNGNHIFVHAYNGGLVDMHHLAQISGGAVYFQVQDAGSTIDASGLTTFTATAPGAGIEADNGGTLKLDSLAIFSGGSIAESNDTLTLPVLTQGNLTLNNGASITVQGTVVSLPASDVSGAVINVPASQALTVTLNNVRTFSGGSTFNIGAGSTVMLTGGTYLGGATFNLGAGATADLTGGQQTIYGGTLTATGAGTVNLSSGGIHTALGGITLNFTGNTFQWTGGAFFASLGDVTNLGTMNLAGAADKGFYEDGTLDNQGMIVQTGAGNLGLHSDNVSPTTLKIEPGAIYKIESDSGIDNPFGGQTAVVNAGTIVKTAGSGISQLLIPGTLTNTGTIEADSGTLDLEASSFAQIASGVLTGGTWKALNGAKIKFTNGTSITSNAANITLDGSSAAMPALALAANSGTLALTGGPALSTPGNFSNSGTLTLGGTLSVGGNFTQTAAGTFNEQIGGSPASGQFGQVVASGAATLAGNFHLSLINGFTPVAGQNYAVLQYSSSSGTFGTITGLVSGMTANQTATEFDLDMSGALADLSLASVTAPTAAIDGQSIAVHWQVTDQGTVAAFGGWLDSVYLSTTPTITADSILLGSVTHAGGLTAGNHYDASVTAAVPALTSGNYYVIVLADSHFNVADSDRTNNTLVATTGQLAVSVPGLNLGTPVNGSFTAADQDQYYQVNVPPGGSLVVTLASAASSGTTALYVSHGAAPTPYSYQFAATANQPNQALAIPNAAGGVYYILVHSVSGNAAAAGYTLNVTQTSALGVSATSLSTGGNAGKVTVEVDGTNFAPNVTANLTHGGAMIAATSINYVNSSKFFATFDLTGAAVGSYAFNVVQGAQSVAAPQPFQVVSSVAGSLQVHLITPEFVRSGRTASIVVTYSNTTSNDIAAPLFTISSTNANVLFSSPTDPSAFAATAQIVAPDPNGPAGTIPPGQSGQFTFTIRSNDTVNGDVIPVLLTATPSNVRSMFASIGIMPFSDAGGGGDSGAAPDSGPWGGSMDNQGAHDPNAMVGPGGYGAQNFIQPAGAWPYTAEFENDGSVAAQNVTVTQQLDANLDPSTFQLGSFGFGPIIVNIPPGLTQYQTTVAYHNLDGSSLNVQVAIDFNVQTRMLTATFTSLDPTTGQAPTGLTDGFLPPDNANGIGEGFVQYTIHPKNNLVTPDQVNQQASIVFDINPPLNTATFTNMIDSGAPTSMVAALPLNETSTSFTVNWSGSDDTGGSGIASYDVFVSENGGPFVAFQTATTATSATFTGANGHTYSFYSVATDHVGNVQPTSAAAQATTTVAATPFKVNEDVYVIGSGSVSVSAANGLLSNDTSSGTLTVTAGSVVGANGGTFVFHADGSFTYAPPANFPGFDYAQYTASDSLGHSAKATVNVLSQTGGVVWKFYESVLNRDPDYGGLQFWINDFVHGGKTGDIAAGFFESDELLNEIITGYYQQYLLRTPDASGLAYWRQVWHATGGPEIIKAGFADSPEFYTSAGGTPQSWVTELYHRILGRDPDPQGNQYWLNYLTSHENTGATRYQIALGFFTSLEAYKGDVTGWFQEYLQRAPTTSEQSQYASEMQAGKTDRDIEQEITNLPEYGQDPPASPPGSAVRLPDYFPQQVSPFAAKDALFASLGE